MASLGVLRQRTVRIYVYTCVRLYCLTHGMQREREAFSIAMVRYYIEYALDCAAYLEAFRAFLLPFCLIYSVLYINN